MQKRSIDRRIGLRRSFVLLLFLFLVGGTARADNPIQIENGKTGNPDWELVNPSQNQEIAGYASLTSVGRGQSITFFVNTIDPQFYLSIYRMGWYGGAGARRVFNTNLFGSRIQPDCPMDSVTGMTECAWYPSVTITIPSNPDDPTDWASGVYLAKLTAAICRKQSYIMFVVRDDVRPSDYLFQSSVTTFQAYNNWGNKSLYDFNSSPQRARKVSFNRPYADHNGTALFLVWEINMLRFLEREGYDVSYQTDIDTHSNSDLLYPHSAFLIVGHDEYWTWQMRRNIRAARDAGISLGFFSANDGYWQIRMEPSPVSGDPDRTMVCYKNADEDPYSADPNTAYLTTIQFRSPPVNSPEEDLIGVEYGSNPVDAGLVVSDPSSWAYTGTGLCMGDVIPGLVGYECDHAFTGGPFDKEVIAHSPVGYGQYSDMAVYDAPSGATVFATGTMQWSWGLDDYGNRGRTNAAAQQITRNVLMRFIGIGPY